MRAALATAPGALFLLAAAASTALAPGGDEVGDRRPDDVAVAPSSRRRPLRNQVLLYAEAVDVAAEGAVWYARRIGGGAFSALHVPGPRTDTGINARWFDLTGGEPRLEIAPPGTDPTRAVLTAVSGPLAKGADVVTVAIPEQ
jgi:hypothetical protein